ncbi:MAG TPA: hypothetical protein VFW00_06865 [Rhodocyclaceae bacterium]|nr:hypothetical protein [Rhodocyclaceae bacterium]
MLGTDRIFLTLILVDIGVGPLATLVASNPKKRRRELYTDWSIIALVQIVALAYGGYSLWQGRPMAYVFAIDRVELISANQFTSAELVEVTRCKFGTKIFGPAWPGCWAWARPPDDPHEKEKIMFSAIQGGKDLSSMPKYYHSIDDARVAIFGALLSADTVISRQPELWKKIENTLRTVALKRGEIGLLWFVGRQRTGWMLLERSDLKYLGFIAAD